MPRPSSRTTLHHAAGPRGERVLVRRSARRTRSVSITRRDGDLVVAIPDRFSRREEDEWVARMIQTLSRKDEARTGPAGRGDAELGALARRLSHAHLEGRARPVSVTWSTRQNHRWGSCTPSEGTIRISHRLQDMPSWVLEFVLVHELAHLLAPGHGPEFRALEARYPLAQKAQGFLEGVSYAQHAPGGLEDDEEG